jgi:hypothetical protein
MYMVTTNWRGALHIDVMRLFPTLAEAVAYSTGLTGGTRKIYLLSATEPPKLIKV